MRRFSVVSAVLAMLAAGGCAAPVKIAPTDLSTVRAGSNREAIEKPWGRIDEEGPGRAAEPRS